MQKIVDIKELAGGIKTLFEARFGIFRHDELLGVFRELERMLADSAQRVEAPRMQPEKHLAEIIGTNLNHVLETYVWEDVYPVTDNGVTVSGVWHKGEGDFLSEGYEMEPGGRFVKKSEGKTDSFSETVPTASLRSGLL